MTEALKIVKAVLLIVSLLLFAPGAYVQGKAMLAQWMIEYAWQQALAAPQEKVKPWFYADTHVKAKLLWPARNKELIVLEGASGRNLAFGPGYWLASGNLSHAQEDSKYQPGRTGGSVIAGHNDTHFAFLEGVKVGERFSLQLQDGEIKTYQVIAVDVVHQSQIETTQQSGLHLITCYPFNAPMSGTPWRWLVSAEEVGTSSQPDKQVAWLAYSTYRF